MVTIRTSIQLSEKTFERLKSRAEAQGQAPSDFIFAAIPEHVAELEDVRRAEDVLRKIEVGESRTSPVEEVERRLGLDG